MKNDKTNKQMKSHKKAKPNMERCIRDVCDGGTLLCCYIYMLWQLYSTVWWINTICTTREWVSAVPNKMQPNMEIAHIWPFPDFVRDFCGISVNSHCKSNCVSKWNFVNTAGLRTGRDEKKNFRPSLKNGSSIKYGQTEAFHTARGVRS